MLFLLIIITLLIIVLLLVKKNKFSSESNCKGKLTTNCDEHVDENDCDKRYIVSKKGPLQCEWESDKCIDSKPC